MPETDRVVRSHSKFAVEKILGKQRITQFAHQNPVRFLEPKESEKFTSLYLSGYGGGLIQNDHILIDLNIGSECKVAMTTQSYTKVFKTNEGLHCEQKLVANLGPDALLVNLPDPVIPQENSKAKLLQEFHLSPSATLMTVDWFNAGREGFEAPFAYTQFETDLKILRGEKPLIWDKQMNIPSELRMTIPSRFGALKCFLNGYLVSLEKPQVIEKSCQKLKQSLDLSYIGKGKEVAQAPFGNVEVLEPGIATLKFLGRDTNDLLPIMKILGEIAKEKDWLGDQPFKRKF